MSSELNSHPVNRSANSTTRLLLAGLPSPKVAEVKINCGFRSPLIRPFNLPIKNEVSIPVAPAYT